jgi:HD-GYP domain-containing protein (c-di-GMP phosphodiesterase class II)
MDADINFLSTLTSAISNCALYSGDHTSIDEFARKCLAILEKLLRESGSFEIMLIDDDLIINKASFKEIGLQANNLKKRIKRKGLSRIEFLAGVTFEELRRFIPEILEIDKKLPEFTHIKTGVLDIQTEETLNVDDMDGEDISSFLSKQVEMMKEIYRGISHSRKINIEKLGDVMKNLVSAFGGKTNILNLLSFAGSREEYTYIHATNVSVLSIFQMKTLGMEERLFLRDIGLAGLFHDIGKLYISKEVLGKKSRLDEKDWEEIKLHPLYGARVLSSVEGIPPLCSIVAFQHHMKYDGRGYPELRISQIKQHICSQVVAISDCFDALRSTRPYRKGFEIKEVFPILQKDASRAFNPFLLKNFMSRMYKALS